MILIFLGGAGPEPTYEDPLFVVFCVDSLRPVKMFRSCWD